MTVANENDDANYEYTYIHRPEFLEFIGRLAWLKYKDTYLNDSWPLIKKMHVVMTVLFEMVGVKVQEPPELEMCVSESDDDYWKKKHKNDDEDYQRKEQVYAVYNG